MNNHSQQPNRIIILLTVIICYLLIIGQVFGQTQSQNTGIAGVITVGGTMSAWSGLGNLSGVPDAIAVTIDTTSAWSFSDFLILTNMGFSIPGGSTIDGIEVSVTKKSDPGDIRDRGIYLVRYGSLDASVNYALGGAFPLAFSNFIYGNSSDLWGNTWNPSDINDPGFGIAIGITNAQTNLNTAYIDSMTVNVYYTAGGGGSNTGLNLSINYTGSHPISATKPILASVYNYKSDIPYGLADTQKLTTANGTVLLTNINNNPVYVYVFVDVNNDGFRSMGEPFEYYNDITNAINAMGISIPNPTTTNNSAAISFNDGYLIGPSSDYFWGSCLASTAIVGVPTRFDIHSGDLIWARWTINDGFVTNFYNQNEEFFHAFGAQGSYIATLELTNAYGYFSETFDITVYPPNFQPVITLPSTNTSVIGYNITEYNNGEVDGLRPNINSSVVEMFKESYNNNLMLTNIHAYFNPDPPSIQGFMAVSLTANDTLNQETSYTIIFSTNQATNIVLPAPVNYPAKEAYYYFYENNLNNPVNVTNIQFFEQDTGTPVGSLIPSYHNLNAANGYYNAKVTVSDISGYTDNCMRLSFHDFKFWYNVHNHFSDDAFRDNNINAYNLAKVEEWDKEEFLPSVNLTIKLKDKNNKQIPAATFMAIFGEIWNNWNESTNKQVVQQANTTNFNISLPINITDFSAQGIYIEAPGYAAISELINIGDFYNDFATNPANYNTATGRWLVEDLGNQTINYTTTLMVGATLIVNVYDEAGLPIPSATVSLSEDFKDPDGLSDLSDINGKVTFNNIHPDYMYILSVQKAGCMEFMQIIMPGQYFVNGGTHIRNITLVPAASFVRVGGTIIAPETLKNKIISSRIEFSGSMSGDGGAGVDLNINTMTFATNIPKGYYRINMESEILDGQNGNKWTNRYHHYLGDLFISIDKTDLVYAVQEQYWSPIRINVTLDGSTPSSDFDVVIKDLTQLEQDPHDDWGEDRSVSSGILELFLQEGIRKILIMPDYEGNNPVYFSPVEMQVTINRKFSPDFNTASVNLATTGLNAVIFNITAGNAPVTDGVGYHLYSPSKKYLSFGFKAATGTFTKYLPDSPSDWALTTFPVVINDTKYAFLYKTFSSTSGAVNADFELEKKIVGVYAGIADIPNHSLSAVALIQGTSLISEEMPLAMAVVENDGSFVLKGLSEQFLYDVSIIDWTYGVQVIANAMGVPATSAGNDISAQFKPTINVAASQWLMFGVPYILPAATSDPVAFFKSFNPDAAVTVYKWNNLLKSYEAPNAIQPGYSYWVKSKQAVEAALPAGAQRTPLNQTFSVQLKRGWNMLSSPYDFPYENELVSIQNGAERVMYSEAVKKGWIRPEKYIWNGMGYQVVKYPPPWRGFWLWANADLTFYIEPVMGWDDTGNSQGPQFPSMFAAYANAGQGSAVSDFLFNITAKIGDTSLDTESYFGTATAASDSIDKLDAYEPPVYKDYIALSFENSTSALQRDIKAPVDSYKVWIVDVETDQSKQKVELEWNISQYSPDHRYFLLDIASGQKREIQNGSTYSYTASGDSKDTRTFKLYSATHEYADMILADFGIEKSYSYPNPALDNSQIVVTMKSVNASAVLVKIFDITGRLITTSKMQASDDLHYSFNWDLQSEKGNKVASGIYIYKIMAISYGNDETEVEVGRIAVVR